MKVIGITEELKITMRNKITRMMLSNTPRKSYSRILPNTNCTAFFRPPRGGGCYHSQGKDQRGGGVGRQLVPEHQGTEHGEDRKK